MLHRGDAEGRVRFSTRAQSTYSPILMHAHTHTHTNMCATTTLRDCFRKAGPNNASASRTLSCTSCSSTDSGKSGVFLTRATLKRGISHKLLPLRTRFKPPAAYAGNRLIEKNQRVFHLFGTVSAALEARGISRTSCTRFCRSFSCRAQRLRTLSSSIPSTAQTAPAGLTHWPYSCFASFSTSSK
jgi:hypothetical protein